MKFKDYYKILELENSKVSIEQIKAEYRKQAKKYHPDLNPGDAAAAQKMNEINEAYDLIKNPQAYQQQRAQQDDGQIAEDDDAGGRQPVQPEAFYDALAQSRKVHRNNPLSIHFVTK